MQHQKHAKLNRPDLGFFHRNEWSIVGTPCGKIQQLAAALVEQMSDAFRIAYVDADHQHGPTAREGLLEQGARQVYTDKIGFHRFDLQADLDEYRYRSLFNEQDLVLVNGNHFRARRQIVVIDPAKEKSLKKRLDQLTDVELVLMADGPHPIYPWLRDQLPDIGQAPVLSLSDVEAIGRFLRQRMGDFRPVLNGLVLAGGKSLRMGQDKGLIDYHGVPQRDHLYRMLEPFCAATYISCRPDQVEELEGRFNTIPDTFDGLGPFGAILSAFRAFPDRAWLVVACDLPLLDGASVRQLIDGRNTSRLATAFHSPHDEFPEPLITIWEPRAYPVLLQFLAQGYSCPRKVLINSSVELLEVSDKKALTNVNHPEELEAIRQRLKG